ncbi:MAG: homocysteine biosynthesis protein [Eubacteriales bacterium]|nr:homocysteine biosynthesis protein [Eubacteriales bacterium]
MSKTIQEINEKIKKGKAVVFTAEEAVAMAKEQGIPACAKKIDVVTAATFGAMCSSGAMLNFGHSDPPIRMSEITLNGVQAYGGLAAVDTYIGATQPGEEKGAEYGGAHVIEDLVAGKEIELCARSGGTDCYTAKEIRTKIKLSDLNQAYMFNPRNAYQNYSAATNTSNTTKKTYMGTLLPNMGNITYSTAGELSPLLKDPKLRTIGIGTKILLCGGEGFVVFEGTQAINNAAELENGDMHYAGYTLCVIGDLKGMKSAYLKAATFEGYGSSLYVGIGMPLPVIDEDFMADLAVSNAHLYTNIFDYSESKRQRKALKRVSYAELRSGLVEINGKTIRTAPLSSLYKARLIADELKEKILGGAFVMTEAVSKLPVRDSLKGLVTEGK